MNYISLILLFVLQSFTLSNQPFNDITNVYHLSGDTYIVLNQINGYQVAVYDAVDDEILNLGVRSGRGPGESEGLTAFYHDKELNRFIFGDDKGQILVYDSDLNFIDQMSLGNYYIMSIAEGNNFLYIGLRTIITKSVNLADSHVAGLILDKNSMEIIHEIDYSLDDLSLDAIENIDRISILFMRSHIELVNNRAWLMFEDFPYLFSLNSNQSIDKRYQFTDKKTIEVTRRNGLWGYRTYSVCSNFQRMDSNIICWSGNRTQDIDYGYYSINLISPEDPVKRSGYENNSVEDRQLRVVSGNRTAIAFSSSNLFDSKGSYLLRHEGALVGER